jgi:glycosyltransferase involved in cell wall biosynthesis
LRDDLKCGNWLCVLLGDGEAFESLKQTAIELGLEDHARFVGRVSLSEVVPYLEAMHICTIPDPANSYTNHCTLVKTMEYMARRKPIVAFDLVETRYSAGESAIYVRDNDELAFAQALADLIADPARRETMGRAGRLRAESQLAWCHSVPALLSVYARLANRSAARQFTPAYRTDLVSRRTP